jgi:hypothetical protein
VKRLLLFSQDNQSAGSEVGCLHNQRLLIRFDPGSFECITLEKHGIIPFPLKNFEMQIFVINFSIVENKQTLVWLRRQFSSTLKSEEGSLSHTMQSRLN